MVLREGVDVNSLGVDIKFVSSDQADYLSNVAFDTTTTTLSPQRRFAGSLTCGRSLCFQTS